MKPIYHHYTKWEDFQNGMYNEDKEGREERVRTAARLLSETELLYSQMKRVTNEWVYATEQNLSNEIYSHRPFLGQTACNIYAGVKEDETREAWGRLTDEQRRKANAVADLVFREWLNNKEPAVQLSLFGE